MAVGFRLPTALVRALDEEAESMSPPGIRLSRTDALRVILTEGIAARRAARTKKK